MKKISFLITLVGALAVFVLTEGGASGQTTTVTMTPNTETTYEVTLSDCAPPVGIISWWAAEGNAEDFWSYNDGTLFGKTSFATGMVGQAFRFEGLGDYIEVPHSPSLDITGAITIETWFKSTSETNTGSMIVCKGDDSGSEGITSYVLHVGSWDNNDGSVTIVLYGSYPQDMYISDPNLIQPNQWYHIAATWDGTTTNPNNVKLFINGALVKNWSKTTSLVSTMKSLTIGSMKPPTYYHTTNGLIDELAIYNRALSAPEIQAIYMAGSAGKCIIPVTIDIKPGSFPNSINLKSKGKIPVAILSTNDFNAPKMVNMDSLTFGVTGVEESLAFCNKPTDINKDGLKDLVCHFYSQDAKFQCGDTKGVLKGETVDGTPLEGKDSVIIVPCK